MSCRLISVDTRLVLQDSSRNLSGKHHSQLAFWGFKYDRDLDSFVFSGQDPTSALKKVSGYLERQGIPLAFGDDVAQLRTSIDRNEALMRDAVDHGAAFKAGFETPSCTREFLDFGISTLKRTLKDHQVKAALHLLAVGNGANFSVPGSGKTTVVLAVFQWLRSRGETNSLLVVGPPSCFGPWRTEYRAVIGVSPKYEILAGGNIESRRRVYYANKDELCDIYLSTFHTLQRDVDHCRRLLGQSENRFTLVIDEAHYIKQLDGIWAETVLSLAPLAKFRWILTGTPLPHSYLDAFNYFDILWPGTSPISEEDRGRITLGVRAGDDSQAGDLLTSRIAPLFYRVRKADLQLAPQIFEPPIQVTMNAHERRVYDSIVSRIHALDLGDEYSDFELVMRLRRGRMMRLRQTLSYARLLATAVTDYSENIVGTDVTLSNTIKHYDGLERPAKLVAAISLVNDLRRRGEKVVVWSNFVGTLKLLRAHFLESGHATELIYGDTPTERSSASDELTRDEIVSRFSHADSGLDVLVANPAACAESISLHKSCSHAIYYDLSYNCAQYLQSLDRIHRVGGSENKPSHYYFLQYLDTIDEDILTNVTRKAQNMSRLIDQDCAVYSLDMFADDDELEAYGRLFK